jgi:hypothetical protein
MISNVAISNALGQRLMTLVPERTVIWPNKDVPTGTTKPYLIFDLVPVSRTDDTIKGGHGVNRGFAQVTVMSELDEFATSATTIAENIAALFPYGLRLTTSNGAKVLINQPPEVQQGYPDGPHWRVPVRIPYEARS